jgi:hypothetical protein
MFHPRRTEENCNSAKVHSNRNLGLLVSEHPCFEQVYQTGPNLGFVGTIYMSAALVVFDFTGPTRLSLCMTDCDFHDAHDLLHSLHR